MVLSSRALEMSISIKGEEATIYQYPTGRMNQMNPNSVNINILEQIVENKIASALATGDGELLRRSLRCKCVFVKHKGSISA